MSMDIEKICRTCLALSGPLLSIYDNGSSLADMLSNFTKSRPRRADNLPEKVCLTCISEINRCYSFKLKCENSNRTLRQLLPDAAVLEDNDEKTRPEQEHKSSQTGKRQTAEMEVQTAALEVDNPKPETADIATSPLAVPVQPAPRVNKEQLSKKLKLEQEHSIEMEELGTLEEMDEEDGQEEYILEQETPLTLKRHETIEELILEAQDLSDTEAVEVHEDDEELENAPEAVEDASNENHSYYEVAEQHFLYDEAEDEITAKEAPEPTYYVEDVPPPVDEELEEVIDEVEDEDLKKFINPNEEEEEEDKTAKDPDYNFTIYNNAYGEEEVRPKRQRVKRNTVTVTAPGERVTHKCPECVMAFVSKKTLVRHVIKRHDWTLQQAENMNAATETEKKTMPMVVVHLDKAEEEQQALVLDGEEVEQEQEDKHDERVEEALSTLPHEMQATLLQQLKEEILLDKKETSSNPTQRKCAAIVDSGQLPAPEQFPFSCVRCKAGFAARKSLNYHRKLNICGTLSYKCNECSRFFISQENLDEHKAQHVLSNICNECNGVYETAEALSAHMVQEHNRKMRHQCSTCKKVFTMLSALRDHERVHSGEKPYLCNTCGKSFSQNANLKQHVMRHSKEKKFKCEHCTNSYVTKAELYSHTRTHTGDHPYRCEYCDTTFSSSSSLTKHKRKHTGERPYACDLCPMRFIALNVLKNHRRTHTGERPFRCPFCKKAFAQKGDCVIHQRTHTGNRRVRNRTTAAPGSANENDDKIHITIVNVDDDNSMLVEETAETADEELIQVAMEDMC